MLPASPPTSTRNYGRLTASTDDYGSYAIVHGYGASVAGRTPPVSHPLTGAGELVKLAAVGSSVTTAWVLDGTSWFAANVDSSTNALTYASDRHLDTINVLYLDGHVKSVKLDQLTQFDSTGTFLPAFTIQDD